MSEFKILEKILLVDDDPNILAGYVRNLRKVFKVDTALGPAIALDLFQANKEPYAVVVSDLKMPGMDGIQFLSRVKEISPNTVRLMLTGYSDLNNAIAAVNEGNVFRFLTKPCDADNLGKALAAGIKQYRLITAERVLLQKTLTGSIKALVDILSLLNPGALGRSVRIKKLAVEIGKEMKLENLWPMETAALLSQMGMILLPPEALEKLYQGEQLQGEERQLFDMHPSLASDLLKHIPRLDEVRSYVAYQEKRYDGEGPPLDAPGGEAIPLGGRILKVSSDYDLLISRSSSPSAVLGVMNERRTWYDPKVLKALETVLAKEVASLPQEVGVEDLTEVMVFAEDVYTSEGALVVGNGFRVTRIVVRLLETFQASVGLKMPLKVFIRKDEADD